MFEVSKTAATAIARAMGKRPNVVMVSADGRVGNYETTVRVHGAAGDAEPVVALDRMGSRFVESLRGGGVTVTVEADGDKGTVSVDTGVGVVRLEGDTMLPGERMGESSFDAPVVTVPLAKAEWSAVYASTSGDNTIPLLQSAAVVRSAEGVVHVVSTDRYRLTAIDVDDRADVSGDLGKQALVARHIIATAKALPVKTAATLVVGAEHNGKRVTGFTSEGFGMWSLEVEGDYPKVLSLFPKETRERFTVKDAKGAGATVKRMAAHIERNTPIRVRVNSGAVEFSGAGGDDYDSTIPVAADILDAEDHATGFNPLFFSQALALAGKGGATLHQSEPKKSAVLTFDAAPSVRHLLMPIIRF